MSTSTFKHRVITIFAAALLAACGGSPPPLSVLSRALAPQQLLGPQGYHVLHFFGGPGDGLNSSADLLDVKGTFYGTTVAGGAYRYGTVFSITTSGNETVLHSFGKPYGDGLNPEAKLLYVDGLLYGTTAAGGANGGGTVFSMSLDGKETVLHSFDYPYSNPQKGGDGPEGALIDVNGTLYGTTADGGAIVCGGDEYLCGTVFSVTTSGKHFKVLHSFGRPNNDGASPAAALINLNGTLYGTTTAGGRYDLGTVFSITTAGKEHVVSSLTSSSFATLIDVNGALYGTTSGDGQGGTVFSVTPGGTLKTIFTFNGSDGSQPLSDLKNVKGILYGTTSTGGANNLGTVFKLTKSGEETVVHSFANGEGTQPHSGVAAIGGTLYGTTYADGGGSVYALKP